MFDFRYHVASLAAVFIALVIGILVGVGLSGRGFVDDAERANLTNQIAGLKQERDAATTLLGTFERRQRALDAYATATYPVIVPHRLDGHRVAVLFVGSVDQRVAFSIRQAVRDAGGTIVRQRSLRVPIDPDAVGSALRNVVGLEPLAAPEHLGDVGDALAGEFVEGGQTRVWNALARTLVEEREGSSNAPVDAVVVARPADPQKGPTHAVLASLYDGLARSGVPAVGVDPSGRVSSAVPAFRKAGLSTVDGVDTAAGRLALVLLLAGAAPGSYGVDEDARDGVLPPVTAAPTTG